MGEKIEESKRNIYTANLEESRENKKIVQTLMGHSDTGLIEKYYKHIIKK